MGKEPDQQRFTVYEDLLTQRSEFFRAARSERWSHDAAKPTTFDDVGAEIFSSYLHCVNWGAESLASLVLSMVDESDHYPIIQIGKDDTSEDRNAKFEHEPVEKLLIDLHLLADKLIDPITANLAVDELISIHEDRTYHISPLLVNFVYDSTTSASPLRTLVQDHGMSENLHHSLERYKEGVFHHEFLRDLVIKFLATNKSNADKIISDVYCKKDLRPEDYHQEVDSTRASVTEEKPSEPPVAKKNEPPRKRDRPVNSGTVVLQR